MNIRLLAVWYKRIRILRIECLFAWIDTSDKFDRPV